MTHHLHQLPPFGSGGVVHVVVESPRGSAVELKYESDLGAITLSRPLVSGLAYPHDWGFVPSTLAEDGDPLDAVVMWEAAGHPGMVHQARLIGVLRVQQTNAATGARERNDRLIAVPVKSFEMAEVHSIAELTERTRKELELFFTNAVAFEGKELAILGWGDRREAAALLQAAADRVSRPTQ